MKNLKRTVLISLTVILLGIFLYTGVTQFDRIKELLGISHDTAMEILDEPDVAAAFDNARPTIVQFHLFTGVEPFTDTDLQTARDNPVNPNITDETVIGTFGSGCIWSIEEDEIVLLTNYHVVQPMTLENAICYVVFYQGVAAPAVLDTYDSNIDCAFLTVDPSYLTKEELAKVRCVVPDREAADNLEARDAMFIIHSEEVTRQELADGDITSQIADTSYTGFVTQPVAYITALLQDMLYCQCYAEAGMSGGPTFDAYGHYVGMITGATSDGETVSVLLRDIETVYSRFLKAESHQILP